jgi:hypothetical protein
LRFKARTKIPTFSLIFALSEYERLTLAGTQKVGRKKNFWAGSESSTLRAILGAKIDLIWPAFFKKHNLHLILPMPM